jgi:acyl-CoA synthetase (AMP-forming)/AMP-acid ligase II
MARARTSAGIQQEAAVRSPTIHLGQHPSTLAHDLTTRAHRHPDRVAVAFTPGDGRWSDLSYADLAGRAAAVAGLVRSLRRTSQPPPFVLIMLPNGPEYLVAFYGCLMAGAVAVPFYPPTSQTGRTAEAYAERLRGIQRNCAPSLIIAPAAVAGFVAAQLDPAVAPRPTVIPVEQLPTTVEPVDRIAARPGDLALLQYTSGSTREPKGVMVSHANLVHNTGAFARAVGSAEGESIATWLPLFHDLGLIGAALHPLATGMTVHLTTPVAFARRPFLWLDMASRSRAATIMAPNFAYDMCVRWVSEEQRSTLDLSSLRVAINGAEPVRHATVEAFVKAYERHGFRPTAMVPGYGLAESTVCVTVSDWRREPTVREVSEARLRRDRVAVPADHEPATVLVGCGYDVADTETVIVDPTTLVPCPDGHVGEIWVTGPSVTSGYWRLPAESGHAFAAELDRDGRQFLRTGDLGLKLDGELYVVGRVKDMIIQRGVNHSPQDVEYTVERSHAAVRAGGAAVFTVGADDGERVVVLCELETYANVDHAGILNAVRSAVTELHGLEVGDVALVRRGQIPKTTSGKVRRRASAERWSTGDVAPLAAWSAA